MTKENILTRSNINKLVFILSVVYILNLTLGVDLIPDNVPIIGNVDDFIASYLIIKTSGEFQ